MTDAAGVPPGGWLSACIVLAVSGAAWAVLAGAAAVWAVSRVRVAAGRWRR